MRFNPTSVLGVAVLVSAVALPTSHAATLHWTGGAGSGDWHTAANWSPAQVPADGDDVVIDGGTVTVVSYTSGSTTTLNTLTIAGGWRLQLVAGTLALTSGGTVGSGGVLQVSGAGGELSVAGILSVDGSLLLDQGRLLGSGSVQLHSGATMTVATAGVTTLDQVAVEAQGGSNIDFMTVTVIFEGGASVTVQAGATLDVNGAYLNVGTGGGQITNHGLVTQRNINGVNWYVPFDSDGTFSVEGGSTLLRYGGDHTLSGVVNVDPGTGVRAFGPSLILHLASPTLQGTGIFRVENSTILELDSDLSIPSGFTVLLTSSSLQGAGNLAVDGKLEAGFSTLAGTGTITIGAGGHLTMDGAHQDGQSIVNAGLAEWTYLGWELLNGASVTNQGSGTMRSVSYGGISPGTGGGAITNHGTLEVVENSQSWLYDVYIDVPVTNDGTLLSRNDYSTLIFRTGGLTNQAGGILAGNGTIAVFSGTPLVNQGSLAPGLSPGSLEISMADTFTHSASSTWEMELGGTQDGQFDRLRLNSVQLDGTLNPIVVGGYTPQVGDTFQIATFSSLTGDFAAVSGSPGSCMEWLHYRGGNSLYLHVTSQGPLLEALAGRDAEPVTVGETATVLGTVVNHGPVAATGVTLTVSLPAELGYVSAAPSQGSCTEAGGTVTCALGTVGAGRQARVTVTATADSAGTVSVPVSVAAGECDPVAADDGDSIGLRLVSSAACDADGGGSVSEADLPATVGEIYGSAAAGNPDCTRSNGVDAADLAAVIGTLFS